MSIRNHGFVRASANRDQHEGDYHQSDSNHTTSSAFVNCRTSVYSTQRTYADTHTTSTVDALSGHAQGPDVELSDHLPNNIGIGYLALDQMGRAVVQFLAIAEHSPDNCHPAISLAHSLKLHAIASLECNAETVQTGLCARLRPQRAVGGLR